MRPDNNEPDWKDLLLLLRFLWRMSPTGRWWIAGICLAVQFLYIIPSDDMLNGMIALLFLAFLLIAAQSGGLGG